ncbi:DUF3710 domain-containing protein [Kibdelosporangium phytohabitans]|uniref:DUF3710 domain-containing protein n=1 Tax=Kibdelosporangium phytohabitans TaxID=860235 RepID=A0A0N9I1B0_9PSEU|nr:DUF3710 domain-containing protein [Kibdelosporangium phytohabitans]ALG07990.1 hypothetical protein AOZ06_14645 [Kibdelosporangium phytohabitans]MBE1471058.1 hypothetical protein [Kibdelosporangium phytohabitans]
MGLFGRRRAKRDEPADDYADGGEYDGAGAEPGDPGGEEHADGVPSEYGAVQGDLGAMSGGPFDEEAPEDGLPRLDLGSVQLPVPDGAQLQVEMEQPGVVKAVHIMTPSGQMTITAYAAPKSGGLWEEVCGDLATELKTNGAQVRSAAGEWGQELMATLNAMSLRFIGVNGPRWMLRGVVAGPPEQAAQAAHGLRALIRGAVVVRGTQPMPVGLPLPIELPEEIAQHIEAQGG